MDASLLDETSPHNDRSGEPVTSRTVEGRTISAGAALAVIASLAIAAFLSGQHLGRGHGTANTATSGAPKSTLGGGPPAAPIPETEVSDQALAALPSSGRLETLALAHAAEVSPSDSGEAAQSGGLRFEPLVSPIVLVHRTTDAELGNSVGVNVAELLAADIGAIKMNLRVAGQAGSTVAVHKGDQPDHAVRFVIPPTGQLFVPHLIAALDDEGRLVISADTQVEIDAVGLGTFAAVRHSDDGRFVSTASAQIGSLVTAVDGRFLTLDLAQVPGVKPAEVGQAVLRLNANVGSSGGTVSIASDRSEAARNTEGDAPRVSWPVPPIPNLGLGGTALILASPDTAGQITLEYLGGSVLTADLVGYYTSDAAPVSASGLLVLEVPVREEANAQGTRGDTAFDNGAVLVVTVSNGPVAGPVGAASDPLVAERHPLFNVAPNQVRSATTWIGTDAESGDPSYLVAPPGAVVSWWRIGTIVD